MNKILLTISAGMWDGIQHRPHHFARRAALNNWTVLYVEPPATLISPLKNRTTIERWKYWREGLRKETESLYLLSLPPIFPFGNMNRTINRINQRIMAKTITKALQSFSNSKVTLYTFLPNTVDMLPYLNVEAVIYDCVDDHGSFSGFVDKKIVLEMEKDLMRQADICFATSHKLYSDRKAWNPNFYLIPNGTDHDFFAKTASITEEEIPADVADLSHPTIGFIGGISDWVDLSLVKQVADSRPDCNFIFIGPIATDISLLEALSNVHFIGPRRYEHLPYYLRKFDICWIPFKINELTKSVNPIKLYEYMSSGKPVISTPLPEVKHFEGLIEIAKDKQETIVSIDRILDSNINDVNREKRQKVGQDNSWDSRWQYAEHLIQSLQK
ncbi:glycosyltransferase involved in cell wall biosynthesis [Caldalkalibacillus uzonensis]|uniref:Glycosyltransferase involved in cell wall biosynthesis n=1 Tax=Caldalkalibacillus uzonensis TaxID=353224 RepID=A0ABU0CRL3_9BACI|nr:glycosyltransferase [Caldalkalibacillus uzonensis]MDQ0338494.1 glycosyltransferase involved in cell wall biosynthesis [Caldalkalibacillus uzonensis]